MSTGLFSSFVYVLGRQMYFVEYFSTKSALNLFVCFCHIIPNFITIHDATVSLLFPSAKTLAVSTFKVSKMKFASPSFFTIFISLTFHIDHIFAGTLGEAGCLC